MRRILGSLSIALMTLGAAAASDTTILLNSRAAKGSAVVPGQWHAGLSETRAYAEKKGLPLVAVWSNGDLCGHCILFETAVNSTYFKNWMKKSGIVFHFSYSGDPSPDGPAGGSTYSWCWKEGKLNSYPFVRLYWPKGKMDRAVTGDTMDGGFGGETGGKKVAVYIAKVFADFLAQQKAAVPYTIAFDANGGSGTMSSVAVKAGAAKVLPANAFTRPDHLFSGWALTPDGAVKYKDAVSVKNLTTVSGATVKLYAVWKKVVYRTYYVGVKAVINIPGLAGCTTTSKVPGLTWSSSKSRFAGTPTKAGVYKVILTNGKASTWRKIVIKDDVIIFADESAIGRMLPEGKSIRLDLSPVSHAGTPIRSAVSGLPAGLTYADGVISGTTHLVGTFTITVGIRTPSNVHLTRTIQLVIGVPELVVGTFNGFIGYQDPDCTDVLALSNRGTFQFTASSTAALSAKIVTAKATYALSGQGWVSDGNGGYTAELKSSGGKDALLVGLDSSGLSTSFREIGEFTPSYGTRYPVWAQRSPFERNEQGEYVNPGAGEVMDGAGGGWYFKAYKTGSSWMLDYADRSDYDLALKVSPDGSAKIAGKLGSLTLSAYSAVFVFDADVDTGYARVDFAIPVKISGVKKTLDTWINLWFDRSRSHFNARGEGIGCMTLEAFK